MCHAPADACPPGCLVRRGAEYKDTGLLGMLGLGGPTDTVPQASQLQVASGLTGLHLQAMQLEWRAASIQLMARMLQRASTGAPSTGLAQNC